MVTRKGISPRLSEKWRSGWELNGWVNMNERFSLFRRTVNIWKYDFSTENIPFKTGKFQNSLISADGQNRRRIFYPPFFGHFWLSKKCPFCCLHAVNFKTRIAKPQKSGLWPLCSYFLFFTIKTYDWNFSGGSVRGSIRDGRPWTFSIVRVSYKIL